MGNLNSREMAPFMDHEITKHVLMNLGDFLKYHGEHEKHRAARSSKRHKRQEEARKRASQPPSPNYHYYGDHHHHHHEPSNPHASRRGIDYYPQGYHEEAPFAEQDRHGGRRNHSNHYDNHYENPAPSHPQGQRPHGHRPRGSRQHGHRSNSRHPDPGTTHHANPYPQDFMGSFSVAPSVHSPRPPQPRPDLPGPGSERGGGGGGRQPRRRRPQLPMPPMQSRGPAAAGPPRGRRPPMDMGMGPHQEPKGHPFFMRGGLGDDNGTFSDEGDMGDDEDGEGGADVGGGVGGGGGPGVVPGGVMGGEGGPMGGFPDGFDAERRGMGRGRHEGLGPDQPA